jgi:hypothetical protein
LWYRHVAYFLVDLVYIIRVDSEASVIPHVAETLIKVISN